MIGGGFIQDKLGSKTTIVIGGLMFTAGLILTGFIAEGSSISMLYLSYSTLAGVGGGVVYAGTMGNTVKFFPDKRGLAAGICALGYGCVITSYSIHYTKLYDPSYLKIRIYLAFC